MLESIALSLLKTLVVFIFQKSLETGAKVEIEGAPDWYGRSERGTFCVSTSVRGDYGAVERAKEKLYPKAEKEMRNLIDVAIYERFRDLNDPSEVKFVREVAEDPKLSLFVKSFLKIRNVHYDDERRIAFTRGCISEEDFIAYEERRMKEIRKALSIKRSEEAFEELEMVK